MQRLFSAAAALAILLAANSDIMATEGPRWLDRLPTWATADASSAKASADDELLSFVPEMQPMPEMNMPGSAHRWSDAEKARFADDVRRADEEWKKRIPEIEPRLTPEKVRSLSRWAKPQMEQYKAVPALDKVSLRPAGADAKREKLVLEGTIDTLPTHSPLVTRWLKVYLLYDLRSKALSRITITIRGERLE